MHCNCINVFLYLVHFNEQINSKKLNYRHLFVWKVLGNIPLDALRRGDFDV